MNRGPSTKRIRDLITLARSMGVKHLKAGEIEFELLPQSSIGKPVDKAAAETQTEVEEDRPPTEDEMLMMSTPFFDDLRKARAQPPKLPQT